MTDDEFKRELNAIQADAASSGEMAAMRTFDRMRDLYQGLLAERTAPAAEDLHVTAGQLRDALRFTEGAEDDDEHETRLVLADLPARTSTEGEPMAGGLYVWLAEYPEEGCCGPLESLKAAPAPGAVREPLTEPEIDAIRLEWFKSGGSYRDLMRLVERAVLAKLEGGES